MAADTGSDEVLFKRIDEHVGLVTINRPEARNAINGPVASGIDRCVKETEADDAIWVVILTGTGGLAFSAGADLKEVSAGRGAALRTPDGGFGGFVRAKRTKPWIAAVNGTAFGGGTELALACDMIVAVESANFGLPEVKRGIMAAAGGIFRLPRALPRALAMEMIATGAPLPAPRALELGMINRVTKPATLLEEALTLARDICANAPVAVRESLGVARVSGDLSEEELWPLSEAAATRNRATEDSKEGPRAFVEKRPPRWVGR
jgi:enoyl-CoA hydratase